MPPLEILAQACGWYGLATSCLWSFARTRRGMIALQLLSGPGFLLHWALQGHWTAAGSCGLMLTLALVSLALDGPATSRRVRFGRALFLVMLGPIALVAALSWAGLPSLFAALGTTLTCLGRWQTRPERFRLLLLAGSGPWLMHNLLVGSVPGVATDLFQLSRVAFRYRANLAVAVRRGTRGTRRRLEAWRRRGASAPLAGANAPAPAAAL